MRTQWIHRCELAVYIEEHGETLVPQDYGVLGR